MESSAAVAVRPLAGGWDERDRAIERYAPLVKYVVSRLAIGLPSILDYEDILSYGTIGLIEALDRFDASKGVKFETYAVTRVRGSIIDALRALDRLPRSVRQKARKIDRLQSSLTLSLGREPSRHEMATAMDLTIEQYHRALVDCSWVTISLDGFADHDGQGEGAPGVEAYGAPRDDDFTQEVERKQLLQSLTRAVKLLPERELLIVSLYYKEEMTMREIAQVLDISESRVCQLHSRALSRMRAHLMRDCAA